MDFNNTIILSCKNFFKPLKVWWLWFRLEDDSTFPCHNMLSQCVHSAIVNVHTTCYAMHQMCYNFETIFYQICEAVPDVSTQMGTRTVKLHPIKSKVNSPLKIAKFFLFQNSHLSHSVRWLLLGATMARRKFITGT